METLTNPWVIAIISTAVATVIAGLILYYGFGIGKTKPQKTRDTSRKRQGKLEVKVNSRYWVEDIKRNEQSLDWIEDYKAKNNHKLPPLPDFLIPLVNIHSEGTQSREGKGGWRTYVKGQPINQDMLVIPVSGQQWQRMTASERNQLLELVEWLGQDAEDYVRSFEVMYPKTPRGK